jgi:FkbM family methyltransferase
MLHVLFRSRLAGALFRKAYFAYKRRLEDPYDVLVRTRPDLFRDGHVLDAGANVGYTADVFAGAIDADRTVYAFEPDPDNFAMLDRVAHEHRGPGRVHPVQAAVGAEAGSLDLWRHPLNPADHRIVTTAFGASGERGRGPAIRVPVVTLDGYCQERGVLDQIAFVKIDVQGFEEPVLRGMERLFDASPQMTVAFEYAPKWIKKLGFDPMELFRIMTARGFHMHRLDLNGVGAEIGPGEPDVGRRGYLEILALRSG